MIDWSGIQFVTDDAVEKSLSESKGASRHSRRLDEYSKSWSGEFHPFHEPPPTTCLPEK